MEIPFAGICHCDGWLDCDWVMDWRPNFIRCQTPNDSTARGGDDGTRSPSVSAKPKEH